METIQHILNLVIGAAIIPLVTEALKKYFGVVTPAVKLGLVVVLSAACAVGLGKLYAMDASIEQLIIIGLEMALAAVATKTVLKTKAEKKG